MDVDVYWTIEAAQRAEIKIKGSRFIATASPVASREDAAAFVGSLKKEFWDATHNCYAFALGSEGADTRAADDGEPSGTAGKPILGIIRKHALTNVAVVVTRYFGGTKLGAGGLVHAYSDSADAVLAGCVRKPCWRTRTALLRCSYEDLSVVKRYLGDYAVSFAEEYTDVAAFSIELPASKAGEFAERLKEATNAKVIATLV